MGWLGWRPQSRRDFAPKVGLGRRQDGETQLGSHPPAHLLDGLVYLRHTAGAMAERVLAFRDGMQADLDAGVSRSLRERDALTDQQFSLAVVDHGRPEPGQIRLQHVDPGIAPPHTGSRPPRLAEE